MTLSMRLQRVEGAQVAGMALLSQLRAYLLGEVSASAAEILNSFEKPGDCIAKEYISVSQQATRRICSLYSAAMQLPSLRRYILWDDIPEYYTLLGMPMPAETKEIITQLSNFKQQLCLTGDIEFSALWEFGERYNKMLSEWKGLVCRAIKDNNLSWTAHMSDSADQEDYPENPLRHDVVGITRMFGTKGPEVYVDSG